MTKYKFVGALSIALGVSEIFISLIFSIFTVPKVTELYNQIEAGVVNFYAIYFFSFFVVLLGIINIFLGRQLLSNIENKDKYFYYTLILMFVSFLIAGLFTSMVTYTVLTPLYKLNTNSFV